jgi:hypothetical protein
MKERNKTPTLLPITPYADLHSYTRDLPPPLPSNRSHARSQCRKITELEAQTGFLRPFSETNDLSG